MVNKYHKRTEMSIYDVIKGKIKYPKKKPTNIYDLFRKPKPKKSNGK